MAPWKVSQRRWCPPPAQEKAAGCFGPAPVGVPTALSPRVMPTTDGPYLRICSSIGATGLGAHLPQLRWARGKDDVLRGPAGRRDTQREKGQPPRHARRLRPPSHFDGEAPDHHASSTIILWPQLAHMCPGQRGGDTFAARDQQRGVRRAKAGARHTGGAVRYETNPMGVLLLSGRALTPCESR